MSRIMTNIAKLLKDTPKGMKLYSPLFGEVEFKYVNDSKFGIVVEDSEGCCRSFDKYGRYFTTYNNAECLLFPSKDCRTWEGWKLPVEPKFKVNTWIISNITKDIYQVKDVPEYFKLQAQGQYRLQSYTDGSISYFWKNDVENTFHLWTIADAKDGDVLMTTKIRSCPFIYRKAKYKNNLAYYYAGIDGNGDFCEGCIKRTLSHFGPVADVVPATKEQRDLLFKKIQEAGYLWYPASKELRKIVEPKFKVGQTIWPTAESHLPGVKVDVIGIDTDRQHYVIKQKGYAESALPFMYQDKYCVFSESKPHYDIANFKPKQWVLVRDDDEWEWALTRFSHLSNGSTSLFVCINGASFQQCIPFEGNKKLLGTTEPCGEEFINW